MQILDFGIVATFLVNLVSGVYRIVARVYDIMLELAREEFPYADSLVNIVSTCYVLAGVFMLFRVTVSMIQMLINPDLVNDNKAGAGKILTRVVLVIILLIVLSPQGILFADAGKDGSGGGLLDRVETAVLAEEGLINKLLNNMGGAPTTQTPKSTENVSGNSNNSNSSNNSNNSEDDVTTCYYFGMVYNPPLSSSAPGVTHQIKVDKFYKISFSKKKVNNGKTYTKIKNSNNWYYYSYTSDMEIEVENKQWKYTEFSGLAVSNKNEEKNYKKGKKSSFEKCPKAIVNSTAMTTGVKPGSKDSRESSSGFPGAYQIGDNYNYNLYGGNKTPEKMIGEANKYLQASNAPLYVHRSSEPLDFDSSDVKYLRGVSDVAVQFAQGVAKCLQECVGAQEDCDSAQENMFVYSSGDNSLKDLVTDNEMELGWFVGSLIGIALIVYLLFLCVEVIIRKLKLVLLEIMAPIAVISYIDPNDKIFEQWRKYYIATYLDLFIKLIAIGFSIGLIQTVFDGVVSGGFNINIFFYIVAILLFAKMIPSIISKIFGLEDLGGSFSDIKNMAKRVAGAGAGALLGAGGAVATGINAWKSTKGQGARNRFFAGSQLAGSVLSSTLQGAGAGSTGKPLAALQNVSDLNYKRKKNYESGVTATNMLAAATLGKVGMDYASRTDRSVEGMKENAETLNGFTGFKGEIEDAAEGSKFMKTLRAQKDASGQSKYTEAELQSFRNDWIGYQLKDSQIRNSDWAKELQAQVDAGTISKTQMENQIASKFTHEVANLANSLNSTGVELTIEGGKQSAIASAMDRANALLAGSEDIRKVAKTDKISTFDDLDKANSKVKKEVTRIEDNIYKETTASPKYNISRTAKGDEKDKK